MRYVHVHYRVHDSGGDKLGLGVGNSAPHPLYETQNVFLLLSVSMVAVPMGYKIVTVLNLIQCMKKNNFDFEKYVIFW